MTDAVDGIDTDTLRRRLDDEPIEVGIAFGSRVDGTTTEGSDVDIAVEFGDHLSESEKFDHRIRLMGVLPTVLDADEVDVSDIDRLPRNIGLTAVRDGIVLIGTDEQVRRIEERFEAEYPEFRKELEETKKQIFEEIEAGMRCVAGLFTTAEGQSGRFLDGVY